jgi:queuine tRNA-ribosyltransferase
MHRIRFISLLVLDLTHALALGFNLHQPPRRCFGDGRNPPPPDSFPDGSFDPRSFFRFELIHQSSKSGARVGRIHTPHGVVDTPGFTAVATNGALKALDIRDADAAGQQLLFANSYHLLLQPGPEIIKAAGGLHKFMGRRSGPIITDSGGFQIFSLAHGSVHNDVGALNNDASSNNGGGGGGGGGGGRGGELKRAASGGSKKNINKKKGTDHCASTSMVRVNETGVVFRSYRDGRSILLTPEGTVQAQKAYASDIIIPLDELPPYSTSPERLRESVELSHRWEERSLREHLASLNDQAMFCVVHGGVDKELRAASADYLSSMPFDGFGIGGSLGSSHGEMIDMLSFLLPRLPSEKPKHLLGIADERSIRAAVPLGVDTFDSCFPTRIARHGTVLSRKEGRLNLRSASLARAFGKPICSECSCPTCRNYDLAYLHHLSKAKEPLLHSLASVHNIQYMNDLMRDIREAIMRDEI